MGAGEPVRLFLCGDAMIGRGVDQILGHPCPPTLHEDHIKDAREYVALAEKTSGSVAREYPWGDALSELARMRPHARIVNLETSITRSDLHWRGKSVHYRVSPEKRRLAIAARRSWTTSPS